MKSSIEVRVGVDGNVFSLEDIPKDAWDIFQERARLQFPKAGDDAWAAWISEMIVAVAGGDGSQRTYFMTDVPESIAIKMDHKMDQVGWTWDKFHAYLLRSVNKDNLHLISFHEDPQNFGTIIATGIRPEIFDKLPLLHKDLTIERFLATIIMGIDQGNLKLDPDTEFARPMNEPPRP